MPRDTRLLYVENDPVLRSMMSTLLLGLPGVEVVASVGGSAEALACELPMDVALLDCALGPESLNGVEPGHALRKRDENIGIVILSQHHAWDFHGAQGPVDMGWSYVEKRVNLDSAYLAKVLKATAAGTPIPGSSVQVELSGQATLSGGGTSVTGTTDTQGHLQVSVLGGTAGQFQVSATAGTITTSSGPIAVVAPTITITGTRQGERVTITGTSTHLTGQSVRPWIRFPDQRTYTEGPAVIPVNDDGTFTWTRKASKTISIYLAHATTKSNTVTIRAR